MLGGGKDLLKISTPELQAIILHIPGHQGLLVDPGSLPSVARPVFFFFYPCLDILYNKTEKMLRFLEPVDGGPSTKL